MSNSFGVLKPQVLKNNFSLGAWGLVVAVLLMSCTEDVSPRPAFRVISKHTARVIQAMLGQYEAVADEALDHALKTDADHVFIDLDEVQVRMEAAAQGVMNADLSALEERAGCGSITMVLSTHDDSFGGNLHHRADEPKAAEGRVAVGVRYELLDVPPGRNDPLLRELSINLWVIGDACQQAGRIEDYFTTCVVSEFCTPAGQL